MRRRFPLIALMAVLAAGCATLEVYTDHDPAADFSRFKTFDFIGQPRGLDQLMGKRARAEVAMQLNAKGLHRGSGRPDLLVAIVARTRAERQVTTVHYGWGWGYGWWGGLGGSTSYVRNVPIGALVVDLVNARNKQLVWRGVARDYLSRNPKENAAMLHRAVAKMFEEYPPR